MANRICNYDFDVIYDSVSKSIRHLEKCSYAYESDRDIIKDLINMTAIISNNLNRLEYVEDE